MKCWTRKSSAEWRFRLRLAIKNLWNYITRVRWASATCVIRISTRQASTLRTLYRECQKFMFSQACSFRLALSPPYQYSNNVRRAERFQPLTTQCKMGVEWKVMKSFRFFLFVENKVWDTTMTVRRKSWNLDKTKEERVVKFSCHVVFRFFSIWNFHLFISSFLLLCFSLLFVNPTRTTFIVDFMGFVSPQRLL